MPTRQLPLLELEPEPWELLDERLRGTRFYQVPARGVLNSPASTHMPFWSVNPYVGCEFGCSYCYARDTHRYAMERAATAGALPAMLPQLPAAESFERNILVKQNAAALLARALSSTALGESSVVIGSATDPYQPAERRFLITRSLLESLLPHSGLHVEIITKSTLVTRDADLLRELGESNDIRVHISLATVHHRLARRLEARTPVPGARLKALATLRHAGIVAGVLIAPIIPGITDSYRDLARLFHAAREADAAFIAGAALRLGPAARRSFFPQLAREFPELIERYRRAYARHDHAPEAYRLALRERLDALKARFGFQPSAERFRPQHADASRMRVRSPSRAQMALL